MASLIPGFAYDTFISYRQKDNNLNLSDLKAYTFIFTLALVLFTGCSQENKAKRAIKEGLRLTPHDLKSYEPIKFGKIGVGYSRYANLSEVKKYYDYIEAWLDAPSIKTYNSLAFYFVRM